MIQVNIQNEKVLSAKKKQLKELTFELVKEDGSRDTQIREVFNPGNAVCVLLFSRIKKTVLLTRQFRLASWLNGNPEGRLLEACAGILEKDDAEKEIMREIKEETGYEIDEVKKIFEAYTSPGSNSERVTFFVAEYSDDMKTGEGGGLKDEHEDIEIVELPFSVARTMLTSGEIKDAKTIILLQYAAMNIF
ncbi:MAG TPA: NUDIX domain-containing protein [Flavitalea sp.]|nr:NUDIX domain-containing protein [Flavitalea sp.]